MYDDIVKQLRDAAKMSDALAVLLPHSEGNATAKLYKEAADVRSVVRGKWIYDHWCEFKCSNCGAWSKSEPYRGRENFCPNCGADMREEQDGR